MNPAARVAVLMEKAAPQNSNAHARDVFATVFNLREPDTPERTIEIVRLIGELRDEVARAEAQLKEHGKPSEARWKPAFESLRKALTFEQLHSNWLQYGQHLGPTVVQMLGVCGDELPAEEDAVAPEELQAMAQLVDATREQVLREDLAPALKAYMLRQLELVERGLRDYQIQGARALGVAIREIAVQIVDHPTAAREADETQAGQSLNKLLRSIVAAGPYVALIGGLLSAGEKVEHLLKAGDPPIVQFSETNIRIDEQLIIQNAEVKLIAPPEQRRR